MTRNFVRLECPHAFFRQQSESNVMPNCLGDIQTMSKHVEGHCSLLGENASDP